MNTLIERMAHALHPEPDGEDVATAAVCAAGVVAWLDSAEVTAVAIGGVSAAMVETGKTSLTYAETVGAALAAVIAAAREESREAVGTDA